MSKSFDEFIKENPNSLINQSATKYYLKTDKSYKEWETALEHYDKGYRRQAIIDWLVAEDGCGWTVSRSSIERYFTTYERQKEKKDD